MDKNLSLEEIRNKSEEDDRRYRDHMIIFHGFLYALVLKNIVQKIVENSSNLFQNDYWFLYLSWEIFLLFFLLESWWGVLKDRSYISIRFLSLLLPLFHPALIYIIHEIWSDKIWGRASNFDESVLYLIIYPLIFTDFLIIVFLIRKVCYKKYRIMQGINLYRFSTPIVMFIVCFLTSNFFPKSTQIWLYIHTLVAWVGMFFIGVFMHLHRDYEFLLKSPREEIRFIEENNKLISLAMRICEKLDSEKSKKGFGYIFFSVNMTNKNIEALLYSVLRGYDNIYTIRKKRFFSKTIRVMTFFPILNKREDIMEIKKRLFEKSIISELIVSGYESYDEVKDKILDSSPGNLTPREIELYLMKVIDPILMYS